MEGGKFKDDLGPFGIMHCDENDSTGAYTCIVCMSNLGSNDRPGYFMIGELGIVISTQIVFTIIIYVF